MAGGFIPEPSTALPEEFFTPKQHSHAGAWERDRKEEHGSEIARRSMGARSQGGAWEQDRKANVAES